MRVRLQDDFVVHLPGSHWFRRSQRTDAAPSPCEPHTGPRNWREFYVIRCVQRCRTQTTSSCRCESFVQLERWFKWLLGDLRYTFSYPEYVSCRALHFNSLFPPIRE